MSIITSNNNNINHINNVIASFKIALCQTAVCKKNIHIYIFVMGRTVRI
jgi:hypothetical protein